jgi:hypothetical protein
VAGILLETDAMRIFAITKLFAITRQGLWAMLMAVLALWGCIGLEVIVRMQADRDANEALIRVDRLRHSPVPVASPDPGRPFPLRSSVTRTI